jgi:hypothetical protein
MTLASLAFGRPTRVLLPPPSRWLAGLADATAAQARRLDRWLSVAQCDEPTTAEGVLAWASRIEATQPGLAADLRTAALRSQGVDAV